MNERAKRQVEKCIDDLRRGVLMEDDLQAHTRG